MTEPTAIPTIVRRTVVMFDICSSTAILEDLIRTENVIQWQILLGLLKTFLWDEGGNRSFSMYKFTGDGWILLFDSDAVDGDWLVGLMKRLCAEYDRLFNHGVAEVLSSMPKVVGVTFGIEGSLVEITMNKLREYVGRPLNVAARLQSAIKQFDGYPAGTALFSSNAFARLKPDIESEPVECSLPNVLGGERYRVRRVTVHRRAA